MAMVDVGELTAQVDWFGLRVGDRLALSYICQMNRVNSHNAATMPRCDGDSTINIVRVLLLLLLLLLTPTVVA